MAVKFLSSSSMGFTSTKYNSPYDNRKGIPDTNVHSFRSDPNLRIRPKLSDYCASMQRFVWAQLVVTERVASERNRWTKRLWVGLNHAYLASIAGCCAAKYFCRQRAVGRHWNMTCGGRATGLRNLDISCANKWPRLQVFLIYIFYCDGKREEKDQREFSQWNIFVVDICWHVIIV